MGFGVELGGRSIFECYAPKSGVTIQSPVYEQIAAAHYDLTPYRVFRRQPVAYQELILAAYRTSRQVDAVLAHERDKKARHSANKTKPARAHRRGR